MEQTKIQSDRGVRKIVRHVVHRLPKLLEKAGRYDTPFTDRGRCILFHLLISTNPLHADTTEGSFVGDILRDPETDLNVRDKNGATLAHAAAKSATPLSALRFLHSRGVDILSADDTGDTPLSVMMSQREFNPERGMAIGFLLDQGADPHSTSGDRKFDCFTLALRYTNPQAIIALEEKFPGTMKEKAEAFFPVQASVFSSPEKQTHISSFSNKDKKKIGQNRYLEYLLHDIATIDKRISGITGASLDMSAAESIRRIGKVFPETERETLFRTVTRLAQQGGVLSVKAVVDLSGENTSGHLRQHALEAALDFGSPEQFSFWIRQGADPSKARPDGRIPLNYLSGTPKELPFSLDAILTMPDPEIPVPFENIPFIEACAKLIPEDEEQAEASSEIQKTLMERRHRKALSQAVPRGHL